MITSGIGRRIGSPIERRLLLVATIALAASWAESAHAASVPGTAGQPVDVAPGCFRTLSNLSPPLLGAVSNSCSGAPTPIDYPLFITSSGSHSVTMNYGGVTDGSQACILYGLNASGNIVSQMAGKSLFGVLSGPMTTMTATVPSGGFLLLRCWMNQGSYFTGATYNP